MYYFDCVEAHGIRSKKKRIGPTEMKAIKILFSLWKLEKKFVKLSKIAAARPISACPARQNKKETEYNIILYNASLEEEKREEKNGQVWEHRKENVLKSKWKRISARKFVTADVTIDGHDVEGNNKELSRLELFYK